jgi:HEAT repeat protein
VPDVATELVENAVITAAVQRLTAPGEGLPLPAREEDVARLLSRGLRATQVAERLLRKLGHFLREAGLPPEVYEELRQSLAWYALAPQQQREQLLQLRSFSGQTFRRLVGYARDRMNEGEPHQALEVAEHYFDCLFAAPDDIQGTELARAPELLNVVTGLPALNFLRKMAEELRRRLGNGTSHTEHHAQVVSCLVALAHALAPYEDFETIHKIGTDLETLVEQDSTRHSQCCRAALGELSTPTALQRLVELLLASRDDPATARIVTALLQWVGSAAVDRLFEQLEAETVAPNRMRLMRLIAQYGQVATDAARKRLRDQRWYVVRNACRILGDLECPDLPALLRDSLRHSDARVQMAAAEAVMGSTDQSRFRVLSEVLSSLDGAVLDLVLDEIMLQRDPGCVEGITELLSSHREYKAFTLEKAVRVLAAIPADSALHALAGVARDSVLPASVRDAAKHALAQSSAPLARGLLAKL